MSKPQEPTSATAFGKWKSAPLSCGKSGCDRSQKASGLCNNHYMTERRRRMADGSWSSGRVQNGLPARERILLNAEPDLNSGCWLWSGPVNHGGYGTLRFKGRSVRAHRLSFEAHRGPLNPDQIVCHRCDTPACVNPAHLFAGSPADNAADRVAKGRQQRKLTEADVRQMRDSMSLGVPQRHLASVYGISRGTVSHIASGKTWRAAL